MVYAPSTALSESVSEHGWRPAFVWGKDECQTAGQLAQTDPTASSADGTAFSASRQWPRGANGICTTQPSVNREIVPVQQPRKAYVFDEVADAWREILEVVSMPVSEPDTPHIPPPDSRPRK